MFKLDEGDSVLQQPGGEDGSELAEEIVEFLNAADREVLDDDVGVGGEFLRGLLLADAEGGVQDDLVVHFLAGSLS